MREPALPVPCRDPRKRRLEHPRAGHLISVLIPAAGREGEFPLPDQVGRLQRFLPWVARARAGSPDRVSKVPVRRLGRKLYPTRPDEPATWISFEAAQAEVVQGHADGIGMCLPDGLCVVDIDHVLHDGVLNAETRQLVERSRTWSEISPSSTGLHLWFATDAPLRSGRAGGLELLATGRFVTITGRDLPGTVRTIAPLPDGLSMLFQPAESVKQRCRRVSRHGRAAILTRRSPRHFDARSRSERFSCWAM